MPRDVFPRTISRGPLVGQRFASKQDYQNARARRLGFTSYGAERVAKQNPLFQVVRQRAVSKGYDRGAAINAAQRIVNGDRTPRGPRQGKDSTRSAAERQQMRNVIEQLYREGLYDTGDEAADDLYYE